MRSLTAIIASIVALSLGGCAEMHDPRLDKIDYESELQSKKHEYNMRLYGATSDFFDYKMKFNIVWKNDLSREKYTKGLNASKGYLESKVNLCSKGNREIFHVDEVWCTKQKDDLSEVNNKLASLAPYELFEECNRFHEEVKIAFNNDDLKSCTDKAVADRQDTYGGQRSAWSREYARKDFEKYCAGPIAKIKALEACVGKLRGH